jgi:hypothetical protein
MKQVCRHLFLSAVMMWAVSAQAVVPHKEVNRLVQDKLSKVGGQLAPLCSDEVFVRRVYLDVTGTLPTAEEARTFVQKTSGTKRADLIDELLQRDEFSVYLGLKWCDLLRVKSEFPSNLWPNAVQAYHRWVVDSFRSGKPYDQFARELLTASGSNFRDPPANFFRPFQTRSPRNILETVALVFMGTRLDKVDWSEDDLLGMDAFFGKVAYKKTAEWKEEIVYFDPTAEFNHPVTGEAVLPKPIGGGALKLDPFTDPRKAFAGWLVSPDNPWFARSMVNRIWYNLMGRGLVHEVDDLRSDNSAWSEPLLSYLEKEFIRSGYDIRHIYRLLLNADVYQASSASDKDGVLFAGYMLRRMDAEVLADALCQITGTAEEYSSAIPEPFTFIPENQRSIALADGSIKSPFLEMFGRPGRDTSYESDRNNSVSVFQSLHMLNSTHIQDKIMKSPLLKQLLKENARDSEKLTEELYLHILSRFPNEEERAILREYFRDNKAKRRWAAAFDVAWSLVNSKEFILKH